MVSDFTIAPPESWVPEGFAQLIDESSSVGIRNVTTFVSQWSDGSQRFSLPGEQALVAIAGGEVAGVEVVGVGGLTHCPHVEGALRVRRFYVAQAWRRRGVARALAATLLDAGRPHTDVFTCNARASEAAPPFWESLGFTPTNEVDGITHTLTI